VCFAPPPLEAFPSRNYARPGHAEALPLTCSQSPSVSPRNPAPSPDIRFTPPTSLHVSVFFFGFPGNVYPLQFLHNLLPRDGVIPSFDKPMVVSFFFPMSSQRDRFGLFVFQFDFRAGVWLPLPLCPGRCMIPVWRRALF